MSNPTKEVEQRCDVEQVDDVVEMIIEPRDRDLGGFSVRRVLPSVGRKKVGPWVFFDHMGPADFPAGQGINVRPHPHINLATVTYLFEGEILHRDSLGSVQPIRPGDINLMVAGSGIVHSERERPEITAAAHRLHGLQLWLALPEADEETEPAFHHYAGSEIPTVDVDGVAVRVMMGSAYGVTSPVRVYADTVYVEAHLQAGQSIELPQAEERAVYMAKGESMVHGARIPEHSMAILAGNGTARLEAQSEARIAIVGGEHMSHRHIEWNFVSSRRERIEQAIEDWRSGRFAKVPGDEEEYIPFPG
ncbi:MAG TPA: pirin family protein [Arenicellales bacterium]|nr:pirin family protein [Arenicellales bacterium]